MSGVAEADLLHHHQQRPRRSYHAQQQRGLGDTVSLDRQRLLILLQACFSAFVEPQVVRLVYEANGERVTESVSALRSMCGLDEKVAESDDADDADDANDDSQSEADSESENEQASRDETVARTHPPEDEATERRRRRRQRKKSDARTSKLAGDTSSSSSSSSSSSGGASGERACGSSSAQCSTYTGDESCIVLPRELCEAIVAESRERAVASGMGSSSLCSELGSFGRPDDSVLWASSEIPACASSLSSSSSSSTGSVPAPKGDMASTLAAEVAAAQANLELERLRTAASSVFSSSSSTSSESTSLSSNNKRALSNLADTSVFTNFASSESFGSPAWSEDSSFSSLSTFGSARKDKGKQEASEPFSLSTRSSRKGKEPAPEPFSVSSLGSLGSLGVAALGQGLSGTASSSPLATSLCSLDWASLSSSDPPLQKRQDEEVVFLAGIFDDFHPRLVRRLYEENNCSMQETMEAFLRFSSASEEADTDVLPSSSSSSASSISSSSSSSSSSATSSSYSSSSSSASVSTPALSDFNASSLSFASKLAQLTEMFPHLHRPTIALTLERCNDDMERCAELLLSGGFDEALEESTASSIDSLAAQFASTPFALGSAHQVVDATSLFSTAGKSSKKSSASLYSWEEVRREAEEMKRAELQSTSPALSTGPLVSPVFTFGESVFCPASSSLSSGASALSLFPLPSFTCKEPGKNDDCQQGATSSSSSSSTSSSSTVSGVADELTKDTLFVELHERFPHVQVSILEYIYSYHRKNISKTIASLRVLYPNTVLLHDRTRSTLSSEQLTSQSSAASSVAGQQSRLQSEQVKVEDTASSSVSVSNHHEQTAAGMDSSGLVVDEVEDTDKSSAVDSVSPRYNVHRQVAKYAKLRNATFRQATRAYLRDEKVLAHELSVKGKEYHTKLVGYQQQLFDSFFCTSKNGTLDQMKVDLHGLRVQEAIEYVQSILDKHEVISRESSSNNDSGERVLYVITGRGKHSSSGKSKLKQALIKFLEERPCAFRSNAGVIVIPLSDFNNNKA